MKPLEKTLFALLFLAATLLVMLAVGSGSASAETAPNSLKTFFLKSVIFREACSERVTATRYVDFFMPIRVSYLPIYFNMQGLRAGIIA